MPKYTLLHPRLKPFLGSLLEVITPLAHVAMVVAVAVFVGTGYRIRRVPPLSTLVPIPLLYPGYLLFTRGHAGLLLLQVCHALQYLIFPLRVEVNRSHIEGSQAERNHIVLYVLALIAVGAFVFLGPDALPGHVVYCRRCVVWSLPLAEGVTYRAGLRLDSICLPFWEEHGGRCGMRRREEGRLGDRNRRGGGVNRSAHSVGMEAVAERRSGSPVHKAPTTVAGQRDPEGSSHRVSDRPAPAIVIPNRMGVAGAGMAW